VPPPALQELTLALRDDPVNSLVGRRVEFRVRVGDIANNPAFWLGEGDDQILVVAGRDTRGADQHQHGLPATHGIEPVAAGGQALVAGTVLRLPHAEAMFSWRLTGADMARLRRRPIYIRADTVRTATAESIR
jgi:hypothetical protein